MAWRKWYTQTFSERQRCSFFTPFSFRKWTSARAKRAREREPLALMVNKSPAGFIFIREIDDLQRENRSTISREKVEGLWISYEGACYYFSELYKRSQVTMITSWKVYLACLSLGQEEEMVGLVGIGFSIRINPTHTKFMYLSLLSSLLAARRSFLPEGYHNEGVLAHRSLQV